jgi:hypothetical protein
MKNSIKNIFLACGIALTLAVFPVFAQEKVEINKMPFNDLARIVKQKTDEGKVDLTKSFSIEIEGALDKSGGLDPKQTKLKKSTGDAAMIEIGKKFITAVSDSGLFVYLKDLGVEKIKFTLAQDDSELNAAIVPELGTPERAKTLTSTLTMVVRLVPMLNNKEPKRFGDDEMILIRGVNVSSEAKTVTINFAYEKSVIQELINRKLKEAEIKQLSE